MRSVWCLHCPRLTLLAPTFQPGGHKVARREDLWRALGVEEFAHRWEDEKSLGAKEFSTYKKASGVEEFTQTPDIVSVNTFAPLPSSLIPSLPSLWWSNTQIPEMYMRAIPWGPWEDFYAVPSLHSNFYTMPSLHSQRDLTPGFSGCTSAPPPWVFCHTTLPLFHSLIWPNKRIHGVRQSVPLHSLTYGFFCLSCISWRDLSANTWIPRMCVCVFLSSCPPSDLTSGFSGSALGPWANFYTRWLIRITNCTLTIWDDMLNYKIRILDPFKACLYKFQYDKVPLKRNDD